MEDQIVVEVLSEKVLGYSNSANVSTTIIKSVVLCADGKTYSCTRNRYTTITTDDFYNFVEIDDK